MSHGPQYRLDLAAIIRDNIRILALRATRKGLLGPFTAALRDLTTRLVIDPKTWGDPLFRYQTFGWRMYHRGIGPLHVTFGVDDVHHIVYVKSIRPFPSNEAFSFI